MQHALALLLLTVVAGSCASSSSASSNAAPRACDPFTGRRRPSACPDCGGQHVMAIYYGRGGVERLPMVEAGEARLGGCDISLGIPDWQCKRCGHEWFDPTDPSRMQFEAALNEMFEQRLRDKAAQEQASHPTQQSSGAPEGGGG